MATQFFTQSVATETIFDVSTILETSEFVRQTRVRGTTVVEELQTAIGADGQPTVLTQLVPSPFVTVSDVISTITRTGVTSVPVQTLYAVSVSTSIAPVIETTPTTSSSIPTTTSTRPTPSTTSRSLALTRPDPATSDEVVVVTQFTTITPSRSTTRSPTLTRSTTLPASASSSSATGDVVPNLSGVAGTQETGTSAAQAGTSSSLSTGAIVGIAIGAIAASIILGILGFMFCCRKRKDRRDSSYMVAGAGTGAGAGALGRKPSEKYPADIFDPSYREPSSTRRSGAGAGAMAGVGAAAFAAGAGGAAAATGNRRSSREQGNGKRTSSSGHAQQGGSHRNKPVPDVPPPVSSLQYARPAPRHQESDSSLKDDYYQYNHNNNAPAGRAIAGTAFTAQAGRNIDRPQSTPNRSSAPINSRVPAPQAQGTGPPVADTGAGALKRTASVASIPSENLGKGAGYASPMAPFDPLGKPMDQKTWRERQRSGLPPDAALNLDQKLRRDSQLAKLTAAQAGTASAPPGLSTFAESAESQLEQTMSRLTGGSPPRHGYNPGESSESLLPYAGAGAATGAASYSHPQHQQSRQSMPPQSPPVNIFPSLPPSSPQRYGNAPTTPSAGQSFQVQQNYGQHGTPSGPIRASFAGPPPAASSQNAGSRLAAIPGSRPTSMAAPPSTILPEYRSTNGSVSYHSPSEFGQGQGANPANRFTSTSIADDIYGGLTQGLSERDLARMSQNQPRRNR